jgi:hypothetical protein
MYLAQGKGDMHVGLWWENLKERARSEDLDAGWRLGGRDEDAEKNINPSNVTN